MSADTLHPSFAQPTNAGIRLWRYMNLTKFIWCLQNKALFFARLDTLGDHYEGYYTRPHGEAAVAYQGVDPVRQKWFLDALMRHRTTYFVSSWHMNERESAAMWRLYTSLDESICIATTYSHLRDVLPPEVRLGLVRYIDYEIDAFDIGNGFNFVLHKRESYSHEREVRGVIWSTEDSVKGTFVERQGGMIVPVDIVTLIKAVHVSPSATPLLTEVVNELLKTYGVIAPVLQSEVNAPTLLTSEARTS